MVRERFIERMQDVHRIGDRFDSILSEHLTTTYPDRPWAVVGIDGGMATSGLSICGITETDCELIDGYYLTSDSDGSVIERAIEISEQVRGIFSGVTEIDVIATETMMYPRSSPASAKLSAGISAILTTLNDVLDAPVLEVRPEKAQEIFLQNFNSQTLSYDDGMEEKEKVRLECEARWKDLLPEAKTKRSHVADSVAVAFSSQFEVQ